MKSKITLLLVLITTAAIAQKNTVSYIGANLGLAIPVGRFGSKDIITSGAGRAQLGASVSLVNFGVSFNQKAGLAIRWFGNAHSIAGGGDEDIWSYGSIMIGPSFSIGVFDNAYIDFRALVGLVSARIESGNAQADGSTLGFGFSPQFRYNFARKWALTYNLDYLNASSINMQNSSISTFRQNISSISSNLGVIYYFKAPEFK